MPHFPRNDSKQKKKTLIFFMLYFFPLNSTDTNALIKLKSSTHYDTKKSVGRNKNASLGLGREVIFLFFREKI
jgi:hypothetical protein